MNVIEGQANRKKKFSLIFYSLTFNNILNIIVMLILVGVTINVALNGGIFGKAETATRQTEEQAILEEMLSMMEITDDGKFKVDTILERMKEKYTVVYNEPNAKITGKLGTYNYIVSETEIKIGTSDESEGRIYYNVPYITVGGIVDDVPKKSTNVFILEENNGFATVKRWEYESSTGPWVAEKDYPIIDCVISNKTNFSDVISSSISVDSIDEVLDYVIVEDDQHFMYFTEKGTTAKYCYYKEDDGWYCKALTVDPEFDTSVLPA